MATIFTRLVSNAGVGVAGAQLVLRRRWRPQARIGAVTVGSDITITADASGFLTSTILGGIYRCWIPGADPRLLVVPDDDGTYLLEDLMGVTGGATSLTYRYRTGLDGDDLLELLNGTTGEFSGFTVRGAVELQLAIDEDGSQIANYRWVAGCLQIWNPDTETWHALYLTGAGPQFVIGAAGELYAGNARISAAKLQLVNATTDLYHSIYLTGTPATWVIAGGEA